MSAQILTPTGYRDISACSVGDEVSAFDIATGAAIVNIIETLQWVDAAEWARWWQVEETAPLFQFYQINGTWTLNSEQSIWRNGTEVCHARHLIVGDVVYDGDDREIMIASIEEVTQEGWWRFDISGDHSYIVDGLTLHNASRFAVNAGAVNWTWDLSATTHWASLTNGSAGASAPGSADTVTFDGSSGGHVVTPSYGGTGTFQSITCGAFTGTLDFSANNNSVTLSSSAGAFNGSGAGTRTINLGNGTWTLTGTGTVWTMSTTTGLTFSANSSTIVLTATTVSLRSFNSGGLTYNTVSISANASGGAVMFGGAVNPTIATLNITAPCALFFVAGQTVAVTNAFNFAGASNAQIEIGSGTVGTAATVSVASGSPTMSWAGIREITFTGGATFTATNSFDLGHNSGITITAPATGGGMLINPGMTGGMD